MKIDIHRPCEQSPDELSGPPERQSCARCERDVHNLSMMTEAEAHAFLRANGERSVCIRLDRARDGNPRFRDVVPAASLTRRLVPVGLAVGVLATAGVWWVFAHTLGGYDPEIHRRQRELERETATNSWSTNRPSPATNAPRHHRRPRDRARGTPDGWPRSASSGSEIECWRTWSSTRSSSLEAHLRRIATRRLDRLAHRQGLMPRM